MTAKKKRHFKKLRFWFLFSLVVFLTHSSAWAARSLPKDYLQYPVLVSLDNGFTASGFYVQDQQGTIWFATSKHVLFPKQPEVDLSSIKAKKALLMSYSHGEDDPVPVYLELSFAPLIANNHMRVHQDQDVLIIDIGQILTQSAFQSIQLSDGVLRKVKKGGDSKGSIVGAKPELFRSIEEAEIGNDVFLFGYPSSLGIQEYPQIDFEKPLLRKGIIAGKNSQKNTIILDGQVHYGQSGAPVVEVDPVSLTETRFWLIGLVSEFVPFDKKNYKAAHPFMGRQIENSGYSVVVPVNAIEELMALSSEDDVPSESP